MREVCREALARFADAFGSSDGACVARAPGRVNIIGEHTDYNDGYVLPTAIDRQVAIAFRPSDSDTVNLHSAFFNERASFDLKTFKPDCDASWVQYLLGVAELSAKQFDVRGLDAVVHGDLPMRGGLGSSGSLSVAFALAVQHAAGVERKLIDTARLCQQAEHEYAGVKCGIMDQYVSLAGEEGRAVFIDCREMSHKLVPLDSDAVRLVVSNTGVHHELAASEYNKRRAECEQAVEALAKIEPAIKSLRDAVLDDVEMGARAMSPVVLRRARHVVTENGRTLAAANAMRDGNFLQLGVLMVISHESLRDDYEVSCRELDVMVDIANDIRGCLGARMTGGGFGGCTVSLVEADRADAFCGELAELYKSKTGLDTEPLAITADRGAEVVEG